MSISTARAKNLLRRIRSLRILVIGDVMLDRYLWGDASRISPEAPVPVIDIARETWTAGGAANVALNISDLGAACTVMGYFGKDDHGRRLVSILRAQGVKTLPTPGRGTTIVKTRVLVRHQQLCRLDREAAPEAYQLDAGALSRSLAAAVRSHDAIVFSDYAKGIISDELISIVTALARRGGKFVALDPKPSHPLAFTGLDLITPNKREAIQLSGVKAGAGSAFPAEQVCRRLDELHGTRNVVVTLGEDGMLLSSGGKVLRTIPTAAREIFDVSGAGDTALAGLVLALTSGSPLEEAAHFANAAAGVVVGKLGTATVTPRELLSYVSHRS